jgi:hypothetical protein
MDVAEMITDLGDHGFTDTGTLTKVRVLQDTIWEIEGLRPWPFLETSINLSFDGTSGLATNFPSNFRSALRMKNTSSGVLLEPVDAAFDLEEIVGTQITLVGSPEVYYSEAEQLKLWPVPSNGITVRMRYIKWSDAITSSSPATAISVPVRHHRVIVLGALVRLYDMEDDPELAARFEGHFEKRIEKMVEDLFRKQYDRPEHIRVTDPDSWDY